LAWNRTPHSDTFNCIEVTSLPSISPGAGAANTTVQSLYLSPVLYKIRKVSVSYTAIDSVAGTDKFNLVVGTGAYTQGNIAPNDNSFASGLSLPPSGTTNGAGVAVASAGVGIPTNVAGSGMAVFSADITIAPSSTTAQQAGAAPNSTYAPGWISATTSGGYGIFVPPNYDAVYPMMLPLTTRVVTTAVTGSITSLSITLLVVPVTPLAGDGSGMATPPYISPGIYY
jgi:hypothetical protein